MIRISTQINNGQKQDTYDAFKMIYLSSDNRLGAPLKTMESTSYPEENGVHYYPKVAFDQFEYKVLFLVEGTNLASVNERIKAFNDTLITDGVLNKITIYNPFKGVKIVGYPEPIAEASEMWKDKYGEMAGAAKVELNVKVESPDECDFNYAE